MNNQLKPCPFCGGEAKPMRVGDMKQYYVFVCSKCNRTPVHFDEARLTDRGAKKIWNKRCNDVPSIH